MNFKNREQYLPKQPEANVINTHFYELMFWQAYLTYEVFRFYGTLVSFSWAVANSGKDNVAINLLVQWMVDTYAMSPDFILDEYAGWMYRLEQEHIVQIDKPTIEEVSLTKRPHISLQVVMDLPMLTPKQVKRLSPESRDHHSKYLALWVDVKGFDLEAWSQLEDDSLVPLVSDDFRKPLTLSLVPDAADEE